MLTNDRPILRHLSSFRVPLIWNGFKSLENVHFAGQIVENDRSTAKFRPWDTARELFHWLSLIVYLRIFSSKLAVKLLILLLAVN